MLPVAFIAFQDLSSGAGGVAASVAVGAFIGQILSVATSATDEERREVIATGGLIGLVTMIGLIICSVEWG